MVKQESSKHRCWRLTRWCLLTIVLFTLGRTPSSADQEYTADERNHWSFLPRAEPPVPRFEAEEHRAWLRTPIDAFVLAKQVEAGVAPSAEADRATLVRRLTFQMTGLPPTPKDVATFLRDDAPGAYERLVDRLLASPHYGEQWGQHWLDVVRYAETEGFEYDRYRPGAWRFRDYVIRAFNDDKPYDQFVREQIAGDELNPDDRELLVAAGFHRLGPVRRNAGNPEVAFSRNEVLTERTDAIGSAFLALTIGCARCHDHFFDPIRQQDYYRLQGFLGASFESNVSLAGETERRAWQERKDAVAANVKRIQERLAKTSGEEEAAKLRVELQEAQAREPKPLPTISTVLNNFDERTPTHFLERGDEFKKRERLTLRVLGVLLPDDAAGLPEDTPNPKQQLANWITDPQNPLTARVIVNRLWQYHFGTGLVQTANDFGGNGAKPTHPELLDFLANHLIKDGWRLKPVQRMILLSSTFRQSGRARMARERETAKEIDPENRLLWKFNRRRLAAHEIRDSMLAVSGRLHGKVGGPSVLVQVDQELIDLLYKPSQWEITSGPGEHYRRSIYMIAKRNLRLPFMEVFDQPDFQTSCARRESSTHAPQALEMLNGKLSNQLAEIFAERLRREAGSDAAARVDLAYRLTAGRPPSEAEHRLGVAFLQDHTLREFALAVFNLNAFLYVE